MTGPATPPRPSPCDAPNTRLVAPINPTPFAPTLIDHGGFDAHA